jgi:hypothetical protein
MNGSFFAAIRVLLNFWSMLSCGRKSKHPFLRRFGLFLLMLYYVINQVWTFFIVGSFYLAIKIFGQAYAERLTNSGEFLAGVGYRYKQWFANGGPFSTWLAIFWGGILMCCLIVSLAAPINRAMPYFKVASAIFSVINTIAYVGIFVQTIGAGPTPAMLIKNPDSD